MATEKIISSAESCIKSANHLIKLCQLPFPRVSSVEDINSNYFVAVFECITGYTVPDLLFSDDTVTEVHNVQAVIDALSLDVLGLSLSHITGEDIVSGNSTAILNLLEVLEAAFLHLFSLKKTQPNGIKSISSSKSSSSLNSGNESLKESSSKSAISSGDKNSAPVLKRKICRKTLHKPSKKDEKASASSSDDLKENNFPFKKTTFKENVKSPLKRKNEKPASGVVKRPHTEDIEQMYDLNFEKKVKTLLLGDKSPEPYSYLLKKRYIQDLRNDPITRKKIPPCKKSFLLPTYLRSRSSVRKKTAQRNLRKSLRKKDVSESDVESEKDSDTPPLMQSMLKEFPGFQFPQNTQQLLTDCYYQHLGLMHKQLKNALLKKSTTKIQTEKALEEQSKLSKILDKDIKDKNYLREVKEQQIIENKIKFGLRDARSESIKMRQHFEEFQKTMSKKLQKRNFSEEVLIENTFKKILDIQKEKVLQLCKLVKEADKNDAKYHRQYLSALKNVYEEQLALVAESISEEQKDSSLRAKARKLDAEKRNQELGRNLQVEVRSLQKDVLDLIEDIHFRELDAQNLINSFQLQSP